MNIKVQTCYRGNGKLVFRALVCGGLLIRTSTGVWDRQSASAMLDLLEIELNVDRRRIRFIHV